LIETEVRKARQFLEQRRYGESLAIAAGLRAGVPENRDVLYLVAVNQRYLGRIADALKTLAAFEELHPGYGRLFQERGHCYRGVGESELAIRAYLQAVNLNHTLSASWTALRDLYQSAGQSAEARTAAAHIAKLAALPRPIVAATNMVSEGETYAAERVVREFLQTHGDHVEGMRLLAQIGVKLDVLDDAEFLLESVLVFAPDYHLARYEYADVLSRRHKHSQALAQAQTLLKIEPDNRVYRTIHANACVGLGLHEEALRIFRDLVPDASEPADLHLSIGHALKTLGSQSQAIESYRTAAATRPGFGDAYWSLANLKTYQFTDDEISRMREHEAAAGTKMIDRYHLCFALGKALENRAEYAESFRYYAGGNALRKAQSRYQIETVERNERLQSEVCTQQFFATRQGFGCERPDPIFIVGLPRAGSTLLEQILASHSQVEGTMELADIPRLVARLQGRDHDEAQPKYPGVLAQLSADEVRRMGEKYLQDTQVYRETGRNTDAPSGGPHGKTDGKPLGEAAGDPPAKPFFIDKMPNNFRHIGLIHLMLPNARIIDARREPMACCFSNFKQLFAHGQEFTYSFHDIARYYRSYVKLMDHWSEVLPGRVLRVQHEDVVADLEGSVRRLLDFCGLEFESQCVEFHKTERSVRTASSEQVRRPINREGIDQWRHYESWLGPLKAALERGRPAGGAR
jgi:tetratricopeptide (TPR) repeat protein